MAESFGPEPPVPDGPEAAGAEESAAVVRAACKEVVLGAERAGKELAELGPECHRKYGRGAFAVHFASLEDAQNKHCLTLDAWLERSIRHSASYPLPADGPVPAKVMEAARAFACDCPEGELGSGALYRRAVRLLEQLPEETSSETRGALEGYDPATEICVCGEVLADGKDNIFTVAARLPISVIREKQEEQHRRWTAVREHVSRLKAWGNEELSDREVGTELAVKTYKEALRILLEAEIDDDHIELPLRLNLAEAHSRLGQWQEAVGECDRALAIEPESVKALFRRGRARLRLREAELARADLTRAARAAPHDRAVRDELELAKRYVPPALAPAVPAEPGSGRSAVACAATAPGRAAAALWRCAVAAAPGVWRQTCLCTAALLVMGLVGRRRRLGAQARLAKRPSSAVAMLPKSWLQSVLPWASRGR